jgi:hypothetical protein
MPDITAPAVETDTKWDQQGSAREANPVCHVSGNRKP